jgi:hypothetical protein
MGFRRYVAMPAVLATMVVTAAVAPAQATVFDKGPFTFEDSHTEDLCGIAVRHDFAISGHFRNRTGKGDLDQAFFGQSSVRITDKFTNLATGAFFTNEARITGMDVKATPLGGNVFEFEYRESGNGVVRDMAGNVVLRDRGAIWTRVVFDTLGDSEPGGEILDESVIRVSGPHPGFEQDEEAFCAKVHDLIG